MASTANILIVDDDAEFRETLGTLLRDQGCCVLEAENGRHALDVLDVIVPDLILLDLNMPVMNGWELYERVQANADLASVRIALLSATPRPEPAGVLPTLSKPLNVPSLLDLLERLDECRA